MKNLMPYFCVSCFAFVCIARGDSTVSEVNSFAYGANIGWCQWRPSAADGVVFSESVLSGKAYSANCGWINLGYGSPANGYHYQNTTATDWGVNVKPDGALSGYAYGANIGWIQFTDTTGSGPLAPTLIPRVDWKTGKLSGSAYSANCGWIELATSVSFVKFSNRAAGVDSDGDGIPDAWEQQYTGSLTKLSATGDLDGDGVSDLDEYLADTDPTVAGSKLQLTSIVAKVAGASLDLTWVSRPSRCYQIQTTFGLSPVNWLTVDASTLISGDAGATTTHHLEQPSQPEAFFRVLALTPPSSYGQ